MDFPHTPEDREEFKKKDLLGRSEYGFDILISHEEEKIVGRPRLVQAIHLVELKLLHRSYCSTEHKQKKGEERCCLTISRKTTYFFQFDFPSILFNFIFLRIEGDTSMPEEPLISLAANEQVITTPNTDKTKVHIRVQQRNGRKSITTVQGLGEEIDYPKLLKTIKKVFGCNGTIQSDPNWGTVLQLQGDQRSNLTKFFVEKNILTLDEMETHGF